MGEINIKLSPGDALLLVDVQRDFCGGGSLAIDGADGIIPVLNRWIRQADDHGIPIAASFDWHPKDHSSFHEQGGPWPSHCVAESTGALPHPHIAIPPRTIIIRKGMAVNHDQYSAFDGTELAACLRDLGVERVIIGGLAQDVCVKASALDALRQGFQCAVIEEASRPVSAQSGRSAWDEMTRAGVQRI